MPTWASSIGCFGTVAGKMALLQNQRREVSGIVQLAFSGMPGIIALLVTLIAVVLLRVWGAE